VGENYPIEFGEYRLLRKLAQGGMAEIFLAQDGKGEICAVKRILPHLAHEESFIRMFIDEARIVSHIRHPNVAQVYDQGKTNGYYYIALEFVQGHSLLALGEKAKSMKIPLPRGLLAYIVAELLAGLASAHAARDAKGRHLGIVHRDVTPQNILISYEGEVKLIDFGVAKARARLTQTEAGFTKGKLSYMSPEQARGEELDARSDLFSVGIVLYEITTNSRLFNKEGPGGILGAIVNDPIPPPSLRIKEYPKDLESVVMRGLDKDVDRRWQSGDEMRDALMRYARKEKPTPGPSRLKAFVYDLFGEPDSQKWIDAAKAVVAPTPPQVQAHRSDVVRGASLRVKNSQVSVEEMIAPAEQMVGHKSIVAKEPMKLDDETRMLRPDYEVDPKSRAHKKPDLTSAGTPIIELGIEKDEVRVPEPTVPARVRAARFITAFVADLRVSWRAHKKRYIASAIAGVSAVTMLGLWQFGMIGSAFSWMGEEVSRAKDWKRAEGLSAEGVDSGLEPTMLRLSSVPPGASITLDGIGLGNVTPQDLTDIPLGKQFKIELSLPGYRPHTEKLIFWPNEGTKEITPKLERRVGSLNVESEPPGAEVTLNGRLLEGRTPLKIPSLIADEPVKITVSKDGRISKSTMETPHDGEERQVMLTLPVDKAAIPSGRITVTTSPSGCAVSIDEQAVGRSPIEGHTVRPGPHSVKVECENYQAETRAVTIVPSQTNKQEFGLTANVFGYISINPVPAEGSVVEVNGKRIPPPWQFVKVVPGRHQVVVVNDGLRKRKTEDVSVKPNQRLDRTINLFQ
jgi:serine/threonine-protein kinase